MKKKQVIIVCVMVLLLAADAAAYAVNERCPFCQTGDWEPWTTISGLTGFDFRTCRTGYNETTGTYDWYVEWRNRYAEPIYFDEALTATKDIPPGSFGRMGIESQGYGWSWGAGTKDDIFIWVDCVRMGNDTGPYYRCGTFCGCGDFEPQPDPGAKGEVILSGSAYYRFIEEDISFGVEKISNNKNMQSRMLTLTLWASKEKYTGSAINGYLLTSVNIGEFDPYFSLINFGVTTGYTMPPTGTYYIIMILMELVNGNEVVRDSVTFENQADFTRDDSGEDSGGGCFLNTVQPQGVR